MSLLLNIDTAIQTASVCLSKEGKSLGVKVNPTQKDHAAWLNAAIQELLQEYGYSLGNVAAVAVSAGPGSYTGLRVGMATAKGLCYALKIPLITVSTLKMMAAAASHVTTDLICPMIDARRMEVFYAVFNRNLIEIISPQNSILAENSFQELLQKNTITFFGNGSNKLQNLIKSNQAHFEEIEVTAAHMSELSFQCLQEGNFADLAYSEPYYGKEFYSPAHNK